MLHRRFLRVKVLQALYGYYSGSYDDLQKGEREMRKSIDRVLELYVYMLDLLIEIWEIARGEIELGKQKRVPRQEDLDPNLKFVNNHAVEILEANDELTRLRERFKVNWKDQFESNRKLFRKIKQSEAYEKYMHNRENDFDEDKRFLKKVFEDYVSNYSMVIQFLEEKSIYWTNDLEAVNVGVSKTIKSLKPETKAYDLMLTPVLKDVNDDIDFVKNVYRKCILFSDDYEKLISSKTENWEVERIALMDMLLMKMAITEFEHLESIPTKVTINEYLELSKAFSTQKSRSFINGLLDKCLIELKEQKRIKKIGRGLVE
jgi:N utilization substance protein B